MVKILIVDDLSVDRYLLKSLIQTLIMQLHVKYDIHEASSGLEAVNECKSSPYDIILMDMVMPELDGVEATKQIREFDKESFIIGVSSSEHDESQKEFIAAGANYFIGKPVFGDDLITLLQEIVPLKDK